MAKCVRDRLEPAEREKVVPIIRRVARSSSAYLIFCDVVRRY